MPDKRDQIVSLLEGRSSLNISPQRVGNFGFNNAQQTPASTLGLLGALGQTAFDMSPAGDVAAIGQGLLNRNPLQAGLGAASLLLPGTIKTEMLPDFLRKKLQAAIDKHGTKEFADELEFRMEALDEPDILDAFTDLDDLVDEGELPKSLKAPLKKIGVDIGLFREISEDEIARTVTFGGAKKFDFSLGGTKYKLDDKVNRMLRRLE